MMKKISLIFFEFFACQQLLLAAEKTASANNDHSLAVLCMIPIILFMGLMLLCYVNSLSGGGNEYIRKKQNNEPESDQPTPPSPSPTPVSNAASKYAYNFPKREEYLEILRKQKEEMMKSLMEQKKFQEATIIAFKQSKEKMDKIERKVDDVQETTKELKYEVKDLKYEIKDIKYEIKDLKNLLLNQTETKKVDFSNIQEKLDNASEKILRISNNF